MHSFSANADKYHDLLLPVTWVYGHQRTPVPNPSKLTLYSTAERERERDRERDSESTVFFSGMLHSLKLDGTTPTRRTCINRTDRGRSLHQSSGNRESTLSEHNSNDYIRCEKSHDYMLFFLLLLFF